MSPRKRIAKLLKLSQRDRIVCAYAERSSGPGWFNLPLIVVIRDGNGRLREEYIQPKDQPREVILAYGMLASAHNFIMGVLA